jgi:hypothetical protein
MTSHIVFLNTLAKTADPSAFEAFVTEEVLPLARALPSVVSYRVVRVDGFLEDREGAPPIQYIDIAEVTSVTDYEAEVAAALEGSAGARFDEAWTGFVAEWVPLFGSELDQ